MGKFKLWVVTDCRQKSDLKYFKDKFPQQVKTIRIVADDTIREQRGWSFISGLFCFFVGPNFLIILVNVVFFRN